MRNNILFFVFTAICILFFIFGNKIYALLTYLYVLCCVSSIGFMTDIADIKSKIKYINDEELYKKDDEIAFLREEIKRLADEVYKLQHMHTEPTMQDLNANYNPLKEHPPIDIWHKNNI